MTPEETLKAAETTALILLARRIAQRLATARGMLHHADELQGVALVALARAIAAHDPKKGKLKPFAAQWIAGEVHAALDKEERHADLFGPADPGDTHPSIRAEELTRGVVDTMFSLHVGDELRAGGEAGFVTRETWAALKREVDRLAPEDRRLVALRYWDGHTWSEVGAALGLAERTAREHDARIRTHLAEALIALDRVRPLRRPP